MKQPKSQIDKRYEDKHKEERKAAHAVSQLLPKHNKTGEFCEFLPFCCVC